MEFDEAELDDQIVDLHELNQVNSLNFFKMRAAKHEFTNHGFDNSSPNLLKVCLSRISLFFILRQK